MTTAYQEKLRFLLLQCRCRNAEAPTAVLATVELRFSYARHVSTLLLCTIAYKICILVYFIIIFTHVEFFPDPSPVLFLFFYKCRPAVVGEFG